MTLEAKTPTEVKDYGVNWAPYLGTGVTIATSDWEVPAGITEDSSDIDALATVVRLSGGTAGTDYTLTNTIVTSAGETLVRAIEVRVRTPAQVAGIS
jgi:hypothetical protein